MTVVNSVYKNCAVCGTKNQVYRVLSYSNRGGPGPSLDFKNSGLDGWSIQSCEKCGYASFDLEEKPRHPDVIQEPEYQAILKHRTLNDKSKALLCAALLDLADNNFKDAAWETLQAAWFCNDKRQFQVALDCRQKVLDLIFLCHKHQTTMTDSMVVDYILQAELLRQLGKFDQAKEMILKGLGNNPDYFQNRVLNYERLLISRKTKEGRRVAEAWQLFIKPFWEAQRPSWDRYTHMIIICDADSDKEPPDWFKGKYIHLILEDTKPATSDLHRGTNAFHGLHNTFEDGECKEISVGDMQRALRFYREASKRKWSKILVTCTYGGSFASSLAYILLADQLGPGKESDALNITHKAYRSQIHEKTIRRGDELLGRDGMLFTGYTTWLKDSEDL
jgi:tetratricopeptide (TPR) repeat protein